ncbi:MAG: ABC-F family ATP-binding cassette domain-containing protein [Prevotellaceae bacterium]|nr:ABC-F family ATP-binding cassette domain-containing protein [Candidatus Colivivens equi]MCQ2075609.1 ABC-F family ATP-binding cassette domain-containing protein [Bacteroidaceae bacterium]
MATLIPYMDVQGLGKRIGDRVLFHDISFTINERDHIGLIAKNGTGKSTLLSILSGEEGYDEGQIIFRNELKIGYLEQTPHFNSNDTVLEAVKQNITTTPTLSHDSLEQSARQILTRFNITDLTQRTSELSGGQIKRIALARVLIQEPDLLILDEPTNHLDLEMIEWLENYLSRSTMAILMVTHDRYFLDRICSVIIEMDNSQIYNYKGNYEYYLQKRQERINNTVAEIARANNLYRTELDWMRRMPQARGHKARYREEAFYELEKIAKRRLDERNIRLEMSGGYIGNKIFEARSVSKAFNDNIILKDFNYTFSRYEKLGIVGNNGVGKSTFIKMLLGLEPIDNGKFDIGTTVRFGYYSQEGIQFDNNAKVIDAIRNIAEYVDLGNGEHLSASQFLQHFLFSPQEQHTYIYKLSGGEKRRLYLCTVLMSNPNFLILDEPTNDLDIMTLQILEEYLINFRGCLIIVSHDRYFMDKVVDHILVFQGEGVVQDFPGGYTLYRESQSTTASTTTTNKSNPKNYKESNNHSAKKKLSFKEKREFEQLTLDIEMLESEKRLIEQELSSGSISTETIIAHSKRLPLLNDELDEKSMRWLELSEIESGS